MRRREGERASGRRSPHKGKEASCQLRRSRTLQTLEVTVLSNQEVDSLRFEVSPSSGVKMILQADIRRSWVDNLEA